MTIGIYDHRCNLVGQSCFTSKIHSAAANSKLLVRLNRSKRTKFCSLGNSENKLNMGPLRLP